MIEVPSDSVADTMAAGRRLAALLRPGDVVLVSGRLGAGKTAFVSGVAEGLGVSEPVTSPSFVLVRTYRDGFLPLIHADAYRLDTTAEVEDLAFTEELDEGVLLIEWGNAVEASLTDDRLEVIIEITGDGSRMLRFHPSRSWMSRPLEEVKA